MMKSSKIDHVLGVMVTSRALYAILFQGGPEGPKVLRRFTRQRTNRFANGGAGAAVGMPATAHSSPDVEENMGSDFTIQFGNNNPTSNDLFLASEFSGLDVDDGGGEARAPASTFALELGDILAECRDAGYEYPAISFCIGTAHVTHTEVRVLEAVSRRKKKKDDGEDDGPARPVSVSRSELLSLLKEQYQGPIVNEVVSFVPMTATDEGIPRYLALMPKPNDPVSSTLQKMRKSQGRRLPPARMLESEATLFMGLSRKASGVSADSAQDKSTLVVRAGLEDTLVLFLKGCDLQHYETLRSLTAYDSPETICSRVLLLQDEYGVGDVQHVLLLSEEREADLAESFTMFFPEARVESLREHVPYTMHAGDAEQPSYAMVAAAAASLRLLKESGYEDHFTDVNMLAKDLRGRTWRMPITWHVVALFVLLFATSFFFVGRYFSQRGDIAELRERISTFDAQVVDLDTRVLQHRIDSMQTIHANYMQALRVTDSLLVGSDRWIRALEKLSDETRGTSGIWVESWQPTSAGVILFGNATSRDRVVNLAERVGGEIGSLTFEEIREWPVYAFQMTVPVPNELPEATQYLREQIAQQQVTSPPATTASTSN